MKAFLLAAGPGTRLRPLTDDVPKCLIPIAGRPLLAWWLDLLAIHGVDDVLINTHHLAARVETFVEEFLAVSKWQGRVRLAHEPELLGSAGTLRANREYVDGEEVFLALYADNLTDADLSALLRTHRAGNRVATIGLFRPETPEDCGVVVVDDEGVVTKVVEKPARPASSLAFAGIMAASPEVVGEIPTSVPCDLARDVLPRLGGRIGSWDAGYLRDVGTPESYARAQDEARTMMARTR